MTQVSIAGWRSFTNPEERLNYIQRIAEESEVAVVKVDDVVINARAGVNLKAGTGVTLVGADNPTGNSVDVTITAAAPTLPDPVTVAHGGTGRSTLTASALLIGNGTTAVTMLAPGTDGQVLVLASGAPTWGDIDCGGAS